ncbi:hypothetical protein SARC_18012, partial [Sphaeroforma arctica JP610]
MFDRSLLLRPSSGTASEARSSSALGASSWQHTVTAGELLSFTKVPLVMVIDSPGAYNFK